jgi:hypothetical protein
MKKQQLVTQIEQVEQIELPKTVDDILDEINALPVILPLRDMD